MLLVLAKEIYECWLVAEDIILLTRKNMWKVGGGEGWGGDPEEANDIWKYQMKWNHFHHMGPEYFCFFIFEAILCF